MESTIYLSRENLDRDGNVTKNGQAWLESLLKTFGYNPMIIHKIRPEYRALAQEIIEAHSDELLQPGLFEEIPADDALLANLPNHDTE